MFGYARFPTGICKQPGLIQNIESNTEFRNQTKFYQLLAFGSKLPTIREQLQKDLSKPGLPLEKVLAAVVTILQETSMRVGNNVYERLYGSFGLTTLKDKHVKIIGSKLKFVSKERREYIMK